MARLGDICKINMGQSPDSSTYNDHGIGLPFYQGNADFGEVYPSARVYCSSPVKVAQKGDILISVRAPIGALNMANEKCCIGRGLAAITANEDVCDRQYLWYVLLSKVEELNAKGTGSTFKAINRNILDETEIPLIPIDDQKQISDQLDKAVSLISLRKKQLQKLDDLIISRFVEMFGDPVKNTLHLTTMSMDEACEIIDGDRGEYYPKQEDFSPNDYCLFLNAKNVTKNGFDFSNCMYITKEKDKQLRKGKLKRGDIVLTTRGTIGNLAYYSNNVPFENIRINSGMVLLRMKNVLLEQFFIEQFRMLLEEVKRTIASGSAQPQLPISTMNKIRLIVPELARQKQYVNILETISNNRLRIQQGLDNLEQMKQALMQKYFG